MISARHLRQFKTVALQRAQEVLGIHLIHDRAQLCTEGVKLFRPVFPYQAEDPLQVMAIHRTVMLHLPGQQVAGDVEKGVQNRERGQPVLAMQNSFPGTGQEEAQLITGDRSGAEGLTENDMPLQQPDGGIRIGNELKIPSPGAIVFSPSSRKRSARALTKVFSRPLRTFSASISFL